MPRTPYGAPRHSEAAHHPGGHQKQHAPAKPAPAGQGLKSLGMLQDLQVGRAAASAAPPPPPPPRP
jgi:hypothetical protein